MSKSRIYADKENWRRDGDNVWFHPGSLWVTSLEGFNPNSIQDIYDSDKDSLAKDLPIPQIKVFKSKENIYLFDHVHMVRAFLADREYAAGVPLDFINIGEGDVRDYVRLIDQNEGLRTGGLGLVDKISGSQKVRGSKWSRSLRKKS